MDIVLIGSGNVATQLGKNLQKNPDFNIVGVFSKTPKNAQALAKKLQTKAISSLQNILKVDVYIICVKDLIIKEISDKLLSGDALVLHTAGSVDLSVLNKHANSGVLYPLQTIQKSKNISFKNIPLLIEASNPKSLKNVRKIAEALSRNVVEASSKQRQQLHLAAVFACNFTNYLYSVSEDLLTQAHLSFDLLQPLIKETYEKAFKNSPRKNQTGPAARKDQQTIAKHLKLLENNADYQKLYNLVTNLIQKL